MDLYETSSEEELDSEVDPMETIRPEDLICSVCKAMLTPSDQHVLSRCRSCYTPVHLRCLLKSDTELTVDLYYATCHHCRNFRDITEYGKQWFRRTNHNHRNQELLEQGPSEVHGPCLEIVELLLDFGASPGILDSSRETALHKAIRVNNVPVVRTLLDRFQYLIDYPVYRHETSLHYAVRHGTLEVIKLVVESGARVNSVDCINQTPIFIAATRGDLDIIKYLHDRGSDLHKTTCDKRTLLFRTVWHRHYEATKWLLERGLSVHHEDSRNITPLMCALADGHEPILTLVKDWC